MQRVAAFALKLMRAVPLLFLPYDLHFSAASLLESPPVLFLSLQFLLILLNLFPSILFPQSCLPELLHQPSHAPLGLF